MTKKPNLCVVKVKTLWGCPKNFQEHIQKEKKKQHNHKYCMFHSVSMIYRNSSLKAIAEKVNKFCTPILTMEEPRSFYCCIFLQERYRRIPFDMELLLEGFLVLCGLKQGVGLAVPLWLIDLAATTALLTPTGVTPAETRAVAAVGALSDLLSRPLSIWKSIRCYRDIRKALLYLFPSRGYGNDNNYVKVNTESKMSYTLRTGWSFSVCLIPNAGSHSSKSSGWWEVSGLMCTVHTTTGYPKLDYESNLPAPYSTTGNSNHTQPLPQHFPPPFSTLGTSSGVISLCSNSSSAAKHNPHNSPTAFCSALPHTFTVPHFLYHSQFSFSSKPGLFKLPSLTSYLKKRHHNNIWNTAWNNGSWWKKDILIVL